MEHADLVGADILRELGIDGGGDLADLLEILGESIGFQFDSRRQRPAVERDHRRAEKILADDLERDRSLASEHDPRRDVVDLRRRTIRLWAGDRILKPSRVASSHVFAVNETIRARADLVRLPDTAGGNDKTHST